MAEESAPFAFGLTKKVDKMKKLYVSLLFFVMMGNVLYGVEWISSISLQPKSDDHRCPPLTIDVHLLIHSAYHDPRIVNHGVINRNGTIYLDLDCQSTIAPAEDELDTVINICIPNYDGTKSYLFIASLIQPWSNSNSVVLQLAPVFGVNETPFKNEVYLYPNPSRDVINIEYPNILDVSAISLIDLQGKKVKRFKEPQKQLSISGISTGQYFLKLETSKGIITKKVLIE